jgi:hypothetical protein
MSRRSCQVLLMICTTNMLCYWDLRAGFTSKPMRLDDDAAASLYDWLNGHAYVKLRGETLQSIRRMHPELASPSPRP